MDEALAFASVAKQAELVRAGEVSSRELTELYLGRIERLEPELNAFRTVMAERALAYADQADSRRGGGEERPLLGVPIAIKDVQDVAGETTTHGTAAHGGPATQDAELVKRLRAAGAVIVGKTNTPELAIMGTTEGPACGVSRNPWNTDRTPGGSSGGSAAAVAAGMAAAATASDGAGSIRIPAANCRVFGLKPQRGRISLQPDSGHWHGLTVLGFETRTVADTAFLLDLTLGPADGDADTPPPPSRPFSEAAASPPGRLRVAVSKRPALLSFVDRQVKRVLEETADLLRSLGHRVDHAEPAWGMLGNAASVRFLRGISDDAERLPRPERLQRRTRGIVRMGRLLPDGALEWARQREAADRARVARLFEEHDVVLMPVAAKPPVAAARWEGRGGLRTVLGMSAVYPYCVPWNHTGQPAASVPAGFSDDGLPIGMQLVGRPNDEATLLSLAAQIEAERPWPERPPVS
jgi:amidase